MENRRSLLKKMGMAALGLVVDPKIPINEKMILTEDKPKTKKNNKHKSYSWPCPVSSSSTDCSTY